MNPGEGAPPPPAPGRHLVGKVDRTQENAAPPAFRAERSGADVQRDRHPGGFDAANICDSLHELRPLLLPRRMLVEWPLR